MEQYLSAAHLLYRGVADFVSRGSLVGGKKASENQGKFGEKLGNLGKNGKVRKKRENRKNGKNQGKEYFPFFLRFT